MRDSKFSRRTALKSFGLAGALLPLLDAHYSAGAEPPAVPRRLVIVPWNEGFFMPDFWPRGGETDFTLGQQMSPLVPFRSKMLFVGGVGLNVQYDHDPTGGKWEGHHNAHNALLTGDVLQPPTGSDVNLRKAGGPSIDQYVANALKARGLTFKFPSLLVSAMADPLTDVGDYNWQGKLFSYSGAGSAGITPYRDPQVLYTKLFSGAGLTQTELARVIAEKRSVLDFVGQSVDRYSQRLGTDDRARLAAHLDSVRQLEAQLSASSGTLTPPSTPTPVLNVNNGSSSTIKIDSFPALIQQQADLIFFALRADLTRVATLELTDAGGDRITFPWLGADFNGPAFQQGRTVRELHDLTHMQDEGQGLDYLPNKLKLLASQWFVQQVAYLAQRLDQTPEPGGGGTMLDNTALVMANCMAHNHNSRIVPFIILGSCGGYFKTGRFLKYGSAVNAAVPPGSGGVPHNGVLVALANAMGADGSKFGDPRYATELPGLRS